jgi:murein DD-endopeptidase MepM/ murein hydrolase activator NlpD
MATWIRAVEGRITHDFKKHQTRTPASRNPGTDYAVPTGTPVVAISDGVVSGVVPTFTGSGGRMVFLDFPSGHKADYLHLSRIDVTKGQAVKQGQVIGLAGGSGLGKENGYGPHLHLSFRMGGRPTMAAGNIDYEAFLAQNAGTKPAQPAPKPAAPAPKPAAKLGGRTYVIVRGDNLTKIARQFGTTVSKLVEINQIKNPNLISVGQVLKID